MAQLSIWMRGSEGLCGCVGASGRKMVCEAALAVLPRGCVASWLHRVALEGASAGGLYWAGGRHRQ